MKYDEIWFPCVIRPSAFKYERQFTILIPGDFESNYTGLSFIKYLRDAEGNPLGEDIPQHMHGEVMGIIIKERENEIIIEFYDTEILRLPKHVFDTIFVGEA